MSNIGILLNFATLAYWSYQRSFSEMFVMYIIPYLWVNNWLVFITYLQHTDPVLRKLSLRASRRQLTFSPLLCKQVDLRPWCPLHDRPELHGPHRTLHLPRYLRDSRCPPHLVQDPSL